MSQYASPESYTPRHLAEKILTSKSALEGERKQVTVLFADLKGSMELLADRDPEEARKLLDPVLEHMMEAVHRYEGTVNQMMGDGIMALFGAPLACEDHAVRACYAALRMQETVKRYADSVRRTEGLPLQIRVGLNSGEVLVRSIRSDLHMDYSAVGQTTHVAARMEQMALPGSILLSADTLALAEGYVEVRSLGPLPVKGLEAPLEVYELTRAATVRSRFQAATARGLTRFVGRESELEQLRQALERAQAGHGQAVAVVGEPGVGKSRLSWEFGHSHRTQGWLILESGSVSYGKATSYLPVIDLLKGYFQIEAGDEPRRMREKVTGKLLSLDEALKPTLPAFLALLDLPVEDAAWQALEPQQRRQRTLDAVKRLLLRESQVQPLLVVFEDLHWIDSETQALLDSLVESLPTARLLLLVNYRPEYQHAWGSKTYYRQLQIDPLPSENAEQLLRALLGADPMLEPLTRLLIQRTDGNPFFLEESVRGLVETGMLLGDRGAYRLATALPNIRVPATVQAVVATRLDRLPPEDKRLLQSAAVIGKDVPFALLQAIAELPEPDLRRGLGHLQAAEFLYETQLFPDLEYTFKHALTHEVAYHSLLVERRKEVHRLVGVAIEELHADRLAEQYEVLAHHFSKAEERGKAIEYLMKAGDKAAGSFANREAIALYEHALGLLADDRPQLRAEVLGKLTVIAGHAADIDASLRHAEAALELYQALDDTRNVVRMHYQISSLYSGGYWDEARQDLALKHLEAVAALVEDEPDNPEKGFLYARTAHLHLHRGQFSATLEWAQRAIDLSARLGVPIGTSLGTALAYTGHIDDGTAHNEILWEGTRASPRPMFLAVIGHEMVLTLALARDVSRAVEWGNRILAELTKVTRGSGPIYEAMLRRPLALTHVLAGDVVRAEEACQAVTTIEQRTLMGCIFEDAAAVGLHYLRRGEWDKASEHLERTISAHQKRNNRLAVAGCSLILGSLDLEAGNHAKAEELLVRSLTICKDGGNVLLELWVLPVVAQLYLKMAQVDKAAECVMRGFELLKPDQNWYGLSAPTYLAQGMLASARKNWGEAEQSFDKAVEINRRYQLPWDEAKTLHEWGLMHLARGRAGAREKAQEKVGAALEIFQRLEAKKDVEKVLAGRTP